MKSVVVVCLCLLLGGCQYIPCGWFTYWFVNRGDDCPHVD
jgi:hypothetical protein